MAGSRSMFKTEQSDYIALLHTCPTVVTQTVKPERLSQFLSSFLTLALDWIQFELDSGYNGSSHGRQTQVVWTILLRFELRIPSM